MAANVPTPVIPPISQGEMRRLLEPDAILTARYPARATFRIGPCAHPSQRHLGRGWLACNLCGEHTYEAA